MGSNSLRETTPLLSASAKANELPTDALAKESGGTKLGQTASRHLS